MLSYEELRELISIDPNNLDQDCADQPSLFMEAMELASDAKSDAKTAKYLYERKQAQIVVDYRTGKIATEVKLTETSLISLATDNDEVAAAKQEQIAAEKYASRCDGLVSSFDIRRSMLNNEVTLHSTGYYHNSEIKGRKASPAKPVTPATVDKLEKEVVGKRSKDGVERRRRA